MANETTSIGQEILKLFVGRKIRLTGGDIKEIKHVQYVGTVIDFRLFFTDGTSRTFQIDTQMEIVE